MDRTSINAADSLAINVWQGSYPPETWTENDCFPREVADDAARDVEANYPPIRRVGVWNVRPKASRTDETKG